VIQIKVNLQTVPIERVRNNTWNPNFLNEGMKEKLSGAINRYGMVSEIIVREVAGGFYEIVDGEHRWLELKKKEVRVITVNNLGDISDDAAKLLGEALNQLRGTPDMAQMAVVIMQLQVSPDWETIRRILPLDDKQLEGITSFSNKLEADDGIPFGDLVTGEGVKDSSGQGDVVGRHLWTDFKVAVPLDMKDGVVQGVKKLETELEIDLGDEALDRGALFTRLVDEEYAA